MKENTKKVSIIFLLYLFASILFISYFKTYKIDTNILNTISPSGLGSTEQQAYAQYEDRLSRDIFILILGKNDQEISQNTSSLKKTLKELFFFDEISSGIDSNKSSEMYQYYFERRGQLLSSATISKIKKEGVESLKKFVIQSLYNPFGRPVLSIEKDPFQLFSFFFESLNQGPEFKIVNSEYRVEKNGEIAGILYGIQGDKTDSAKLLAFLKNHNLYKKEKLFFASLSFYSVTAKEQAIWESNLFGGVSLCLILFLFYFYFRTLRHLIISLGLIGVSSSIGLWVTTILTGEFHVLTFLFSIGVLGVMADYFIHYFMEEASQEHKNGLDALKKVRKPLLFSFFTSSIGFILFLLIKVKIFYQFSIFSLVTLLGAVALVNFLLPRLYQYRPQQILLSVQETWIKSKLGKLNLGKILFTLSFLSILAIFFIGVKNEIRDYSKKDSELLKNEIVIQNFLDSSLKFEQLIISCSNLENCLIKEEFLKEKLVKRGIKASYLSNWVPSLDMQEKSFHFYNELRPEAERFLNELSIKKKAELSEKMTAISINPFIPTIVKRQLISTSLDNSILIVPILDSNNINLESFTKEDIFYIDKIGSINSTFDLYSIYFLCCLVSLFALLALLFGRVYDVRSLGKLLAPTFLSVTISLGVSGVFIGNINLIQILASILILALGLDYSFYYFFNRKDSPVVSRAVNFSTLTTLFSFGVLMFSGTNAVSTFGMVVFLGMIQCWFYVSYFNRDSF